MKSNYLIISVLAVFLPIFSFSQKLGLELSIRRAAGPISLDGSLDEADWSRAAVAKNFQLNSPTDTISQPWQTEARLTFDDKNLYVGLVCFEKRADYTVQSLRRDFGPGTSDVINVCLDPSRDQLNGFVFAVNPLNVQREALVSLGQELGLVWDNKWKSVVKNFDDRWVVELAIPFKTLRYKLAPDGQQNRWGLNFIRVKLKNFEVGTWSPVPNAFNPLSLAFEGTLVWMDAPPKPGVNISLIPYATAGFSTDFPRNDALEALPTEQKFSKGLGGDAKISITPSLNLDLTFNPDFSQVEVDKQVANVSRFELFFPETRQFFLENQDLFSFFGFPTTRPFFSRRIGLAYNPVAKTHEKVPILAGARLSGKLTDKLRIGLLNMTTDRKNWDADHVNPSANFTVATLQRQVFSRSTIGAVFVDKENFLEKLNATQRAGYQPFNRMAGLEYNLYSKDNRWEGEWYYHRSFSPEPTKRGATWASFLSYGDRNFKLHFGYFGVDSFYTADAGFVPRNAIQGLYPGGELFFWPRHRNWLTERLINSSVALGGEATLDLNWKLADSYFYPQFRLNFKDQSQFVVGMNLDRTTLFEPFDPTHLASDGEQPLPVGVYRAQGFQTSYTSSTSYDFQGNTSVGFGEYFNGHALQIEGSLAFRRQPIGLLTMNFGYYDIRLPKPYATARFWLIGPKAEVSFRRDLFLSAFFQYNTQANNFNLNTRLQWRFAPVSDVFLVYTDNSFAEKIPNSRIQFLTPKSRAVVLKIVFWLNV